MVAQPNSSAMRRAATYILHCCRTWASVRSVVLVRAELELHPRVLEPVVDALRLGVGDRLHLGVQRGLAQALLEDARRVEQLVGDDGVVHAHAALVEDAHDRLVPLEVAGELLAQGDGVARGADDVLAVGLDVAGVVRDLPVLQPLAQAVDEELVGEVLAPQGAYATPALVSEPLRLSIPTRPGQVPLQLARVRIGPRWVDQAGQDVVRILPDGLGDDQRRVGVDRPEDLHAVLLAVDEAVPLGRGRRDGRAGPCTPSWANAARDLRLHGGLRRLALLVGGGAQVAAGDEGDGLGGGHERTSLWRVNKGNWDGKRVLCTVATLSFADFPLPAPRLGRGRPLAARRPRPAVDEGSPSEWQANSPPLRDRERR